MIINDIANIQRKKSESPAKKNSMDNIEKEISRIKNRLQKNKGLINLLYTSLMRFWRWFSEILSRGTF
jgi:hypothetical protein